MVLGTMVENFVCNVDFYVGVLEARFRLVEVVRVDTVVQD